MRTERVTSNKGPVGGLCFGLIVLFAVVGLSQDVLAYVDLGSGSYMLQLLMATFFGMLFAARSTWARLREKYLGRRGR
jgi:hypothetical protein